MTCPHRASDTRRSSNPPGRALYEASFISHGSRDQRLKSAQISSRGQSLSHERNLVRGSRPRSRRAAPPVGQLLSHREDRRWFEFCPESVDRFAKV